MTKEPYYILKYNFSLVNFDILINGVLVFSYAGGGSMSSSFPINHFILASGKQSINIIFTPSAAGAPINEAAEGTLKIERLDAEDLNPETGTIVYEHTIAKEQLAKLIFNDEFIAEVPYKLEGWLSAEFVDPKDKHLLDKIASFYKEVFNLFEKESANEIFRLMETRYEETDKALYLRDDDIGQLRHIFSVLSEERYVIQRFPDQPKFVFYADNRVVNLIREDGSPIIYYKKRDANEDFSFPFFVMFYNDSVEIIR